MLQGSLLVFAAFITDLMIGDPRALPHPVILIGKCISWLEQVIRRLISEKYLKIGGAFMPLIIAGGSYAAVYGLLQLLGAFHYWAAAVAEIWIISTTVAVKGLGDAGMEVYRPLMIGGLKTARKNLGMIVGRDTGHLDEAEISRGAVETVAENIVDAIISPLFFAFIGGAPLAMFYRAVNTLDSMVGYKNDKYIKLGWASARLDDVLNYIPARLTAMIMLLVFALKKLDAKNAARIMKRDARLHPSPNSGYPESAVAGALHIQLGGTNHYFGKPSHRAHLGDPKRFIEAADILTTIAVMKWTAFLFAAVVPISVLLFCLL
ncbi:adenosylcobinamide-phosphate synthase CbiB [Peribacillus sp. SCS-37]|uniref:adenosylcobinamide-phosphate synthase CbiB n=1 Tax=Paraperibacillus esterisolvens TaxID=3115296 RepID=UPI003905A36C